MWTAVAKLPLFSGEIHVAVLGPASFLPRRMTGARAGRESGSFRSRSPNANFAIRRRWRKGNSEVLLELKIPAFAINMINMEDKIQYG